LWLKEKAPLFHNPKQGGGENEQEGITRAF
jgi:hypothetical protein